MNDHNHFKELSMYRFAAALHLLGLSTLDRARARTADLRATPDRGSVSLEQVVVAVGLVAVAAIVIAAVTAAVQRRVGGL